MVRKRLSTRYLIVALPVVIALATLGAGSVLAQEAAPAVPSPAGAPTTPAPAGAPAAPALPAGVVPPTGYVIGFEDVLSIVFQMHGRIVDDGVEVSRHASRHSLELVFRANVGRQRGQLARAGVEGCQRLA